jgi:hypothetical protein
MKTAWSLPGGFFSGEKRCKSLIFFAFIRAEGFNTPPNLRTKGSMVRACRGILSIKP